MFGKKRAKHNCTKAAWIGEVRSCKETAFKHCANTVLVSQVGSRLEGCTCQSSGGAQSLPALRYKLPTLTADARVVCYGKGFGYFSQASWVRFW